MDTGHQTPVEATPPGWYLDPKMAGTRRYWDGTSWTEHVAPAGPPPGPPAPARRSVFGPVLGALIAFAVILFIVFSVVNTQQRDAQFEQDFNDRVCGEYDATC